MSDEAKKTRSQFRTFAGDLELARQKREGAPGSTSKDKDDKESKQSPSTDNQKTNKTVAPTPKLGSLIKTVKPSASTPKPIKPIEAQIPDTTKTSTPRSEVTPTQIKETRIPAFHEIKNNTPIQENIVATPDPKKIKTKRKKTKPKKDDQTKHRANIGFDAKVITDTKSDRFKLIPSIIASLQKWFKKLQSNHKKKKTPTYTLTETSRRKGVIQKATSKTATIFTADNETLKEHIRKRRQQEKLDDLAEESVSEIESSIFTQPSTKLLEAPDEEIHDTTQNVEVEFKKISKPEPVKKEVVERKPVITEPTEATPLFETSDLNEARWASSHQTVKKSETVQATNTEEEPTTEEEIEPTPEVVEEKETKTVLPQSTTSRQPRPSSILDSDTNTLTITIVVAVVSLVAIIFAAYIVVQQINSPANEVNMSPTSPDSILHNSEVVTTTLSTTDLNNLPKLITNTANSAPVGLVELALLSPLGDELTPSYTFELLDFQTLPNFRQSILTTRFVTINRSTPALLVQFVDKDTVQGGLLNWELNMLKDLSVLYDLPKELDGKFVDETIDGIDVRVLYDNENTVLVYSIISDSTAVIANSKASLSQIIQLGLSD
jgi:hypothetical protein